MATRQIVRCTKHSAHYRTTSWILTLRDFRELICLLEAQAYAHILLFPSRALKGIPGDSRRTRW